MGDYNPSAAHGILGQEWVGIREEALAFSPQVNVVEAGHTFVTTTPQVLQDGRIYVREMPPNLGSSVHSIAIYPTGSEGLSGPVRRLVIPTQSAFITGASIAGSGSAASALLTPYAGSNYILMNTAAAQSWVSLGFNTNPYTILNGKRIVRVSLLYAAEYDYSTDGDVVGPLIYVSETPALTSGSLGVQYSDGDEVPQSATPSPVVSPLTVDLGEVCHFWSAGTGPNNAEALPWTFADLQRFDQDTAGTKLYVNIVSGSNVSALPGAIILWYAALEVLFCEEQRTIVGASYRAAGSGAELQYGANPIRLRSWPARALNPTLAAGSWTAVASTLSRGGAETDVGYPTLNALRELYQIPSHAGVRVDLTQTVGDEFSAAATHILPQISLHASGGTLTEPHAYGRQWAAPVYGSVTATQEIRDDTAGVAGSYPQIRFWARHWTGTTQALMVSGLGALSGSVASISVADFDELAIIRDGWREVNLRFGSAPTMGASSPDPQWMWHSFGEVAGSRWEVLSVQAPASSGIAGDLLQLVVPAAQRVDVATYQPPVGSTVELTTISAYASGGPAAQSDIDACVIFSTDPYTVTGLSVSSAQQEISGIAEDCGGVPCCIPTAINYNRITWPTIAVSSSGFGAFELQRYDGVTDDWHTIMSASSNAVTGFNDYEARVGQPSVYRARVLNLYRFAGAWSDQVTGTVEAPGVDIECDGDASGVLIFTSNAVQDGSSNLAYIMQFGQNVEEPFTFVEAGQMQMRRQYGRDYQVASRPSERGGEAFSRLMLVQAAAGALPNMANMRSLRDLAWADLDYVCVRDELGNRWLANVNVPDGNISQRRTYVARVDITEVTATPTEVDPE